MVHMSDNRSLLKSNFAWPSCVWSQLPLFSKVLRGMIFFICEQLFASVPSPAHFLIVISVPGQKVSCVILKPEKALKTLRHAIYLDGMNLTKNLNLTIFVTILNITEYTHCDQV